jgi:DNA-binding CsgD family transcriptional regulator
MKAELSQKTLAGIRKSLSRLVQSLEREAFVFVDPGGRSWVNGRARELISRGNLSSDEFIRWLSAGSSQLLDLSYEGMAVTLCSFPEKSVLAFLSPKGSAPESAPIRLTPREKKALAYLAKGLANKEIAAAMKIGTGTVNTHLDNIYRKLGCRNRVAACLIALRKGLMLPPEAPESTADTKI